MIFQLGYYFFFQVGDPSQQKLGGAAGLSSLPTLGWAPAIKWQILDVVLVLLKAVQLVPGSPLSTGGRTHKRMRDNPTSLARSPSTLAVSLTEELIISALYQTPTISVCVVRLRRGASARSMTCSGV